MINPWRIAMKRKYFEEVYEQLKPQLDRAGERMEELEQLVKDLLQERDDLKKALEVKEAEINKMNDMMADKDQMIEDLRFQRDLLDRALCNPHLLPDPLHGMYKVTCNGEEKK